MGAEKVSEKLSKISLAMKTVKMEEKSTVSKQLRGGNRKYLRDVEFCLKRICNKYLNYSFRTL